MDTLYLTGRITEDGKLEVELPEGIAPTDVEITIKPLPVEKSEAEIAWEEQPWTDEEIREMMRVEPKTGAEIAKFDVIGAWKHKGITDSQEWVQEQRRKRRERRGW